MALIHQHYLARSVEDPKLELAKLSASLYENGAVQGSGYRARQILEALWANGKASIREIQEAFPEPRPAYTTIQTTVYRLEEKKAVRRVRKISNAHIFEPIVARDVTRHRLLDEILSFFGGRAQPMMAQLAEAGKLSFEDVRELEKMPKKLESEQKGKGQVKRNAQ